MGLVGRMSAPLREGDFGFRSAMLTSLSGLLASRCRGGPERPDSGFIVLHSATQLGDRAEEGPLPGIPTQDAIEQASAGVHDLTRHTHKRVEEGLELHAQDRLLFLLMTLDVPARSLGRPQREPSLQVPRQRRHHFGSSRKISRY